jgi:hypothetical protein
MDAVSSSEMLVPICGELHGVTSHKTIILTGRTQISYKQLYRVKSRLLNEHQYNTLSRLQLMIRLDCFLIIRKRIKLKKLSVPFTVLRLLLISRLLCHL